MEKFEIIERELIAIEALGYKVYREKFMILLRYGFEAKSLDPIYEAELLTFHVSDVERGFAREVLILLKSRL